MLISRSRVVKQLGVSDSDSACSRRRATENESLGTARERVAVVGRRRSPFGFLFLIRRAAQRSAAPLSAVGSRQSAFIRHFASRSSLRFAEPRRSHIAAVTRFAPSSTATATATATVAVAVRLFAPNVEPHSRVNAPFRFSPVESARQSPRSVALLSRFTYAYSISIRPTLRYEY